MLWLLHGNLGSPADWKPVMEVLRAGEVEARATRNSRMPPEIFRVDGSSPSRSSRNFPEKKNRSSRLRANTSSRIRMAFCWAAEYYFSIP